VAGVTAPKLNRRPVEEQHPLRLLPRTNRGYETGVSGADDYDVPAPRERDGRGGARMEGGLDDGVLFSYFPVNFGGRFCRKAARASV
jgi:hypothetical protein